MEQLMNRWEQELNRLDDEMNKLRTQYYVFEELTQEEFHKELTALESQYQELEGRLK